MKLELTLEEAKAILHCLTRTNARNTNGVLDLSEKVEDRLSDLIAEEEQTPLKKEETKNKHMENKPLDLSEQLHGLVIIHIESEEGHDIYILTEHTWEDLARTYELDNQAIIDSEEGLPLYIEDDDLLTYIRKNGHSINPEVYLTEIF